MNVEQQKETLPVRNVSELFTSSTTQQQGTDGGRHGSLLPDSVRALIVGPSGCGKTNVALSLLLAENGLKFDGIYLYTTTAWQDMYRFLAKVTEGICPLYVFDKGESVVKPADARPNSVFLFDDVALEKQDAVKEHFSAGRHKHNDALYMCQTYTKIPKQLVRDNANVIVLFRQDDHNLQVVYNEHVDPSDFEGSFEKFKTLCYNVWKGNTHAFLVIDKTRSVRNGRYRDGFDKFIIV